MHNPYRLVRIAALLLVSILPALTQAASTIEAQREAFNAAKRALDAGKRTEFQRLSAELRDYPLYPYLVYWDLYKRIGEQDAKAVAAFLAAQADTPLAEPLRAVWLQRLGKEQRWGEYLDFYTQSDDEVLQCYYQRALYAKGERTQALEGAKGLWLSGKSVDNACNPLFDALVASGQITRELRWQRITLAIDKRNFSLVSYLAKGLDSHDRGWAELWIAAHEKPALLLEDVRLQQESEMARLIVVSVLDRLARSDLEQAQTLWAQIAPHLPFTQAQRDTLNNRFGLELALDGKPEALDWFKRVSQAGRDENTYTWAVRSALRNQAWAAGLEWVAQMPSDLANEPDWLYWRGRLLETLGRKEEARPFYQQAGQQLGYYGFLAIDRLGEEYRLDSRPIQSDATRKAELAQRPSFLRAHELLALARNWEARREWFHAIRGLDKAGLIAAGALAREWGWHDRALVTLARADYYDDLEIRFPLLHTEQIFDQAKSHAIDPAWVLAVARQESAFIADVRSHAGALGLMQIMPQTGRMIARALNTRWLGSNQLLSPETNIRFGTYYLRSVLDELDENPVLATAAYNAGPHRVRRWYPEQGTLPADIWVETVPFNETRTYLRRVFAYTVIYDARLGRKVTRLSDRMPEVGRQAPLLTVNEARGEGRG